MSGGQREVADSNTGLWASLAAAIPGFGALGWAIFRTMEGQHQAHTIVLAQETEEHAAESARAILDDAQKEWFDGMRQDLRDARTENAELRRDRNRGWDLARAWRELCRDERHARNSLLQMHSGDALPLLPALEEIEGKKESS
jgi:hypothetical protein